MAKWKLEYSEEDEWCDIVHIPCEALVYLNDRLCPSCQKKVPKEYIVQASLVDDTWIEEEDEL